ncbi:MAG: pyruvate ferredoxin oxidoreductase [Candidatus Latescibacteria bacterium]|nr:pyruvate ferredoxin oxidoreductase [Candidatus Latescibacterota bacterium]NIM21152.1 pyruvate ferredoxin oxidoreductase [Candidatus Latescibacterota bacterium]NIM65287.1 pyruvate ferredoxin oxidoreductase [Candidatus Latescibacterota bacterium]NIO01802.1 pyruvate ferredoxin oxidoreductase [Candidatus Latescibacterota bacterium]NIO28319.1 pyruvate ferredoxin oxidoreductase [Candidatus Latescibacterota bacterium]
MVEIRTHGRGGQGAVVASKVLAAALFKEGRFVQAFPAFGVERRGAPVVAFTRFDSEPIRLRCEIYEPDHLIVLDHALTETIDVAAGLKKGGWIVINSHANAEDFSYSEVYRLAIVDANEIAWRHRLGSRSAPIVNTAILGAFSRATGLVGLKAVLEAIAESVPFNPEGNKQAAIDAFNETRISNAMKA